jgi:SAM-dependent methyltransferase
MNWQSWFDRWEAMQSVYVVDRDRRIDLMLRIVDLLRAPSPTVLDLGCGPGSLTFKALELNPQARAVAVDLDPVLLELGRRVAGDKAGRIEFRKLDLREAGWWDEYRGRFDFVLSMTALHWLSPENLHQVYARVFAALKPGGWFVFSDHVASDFPDTLSRHRMILRDRQQAGFARTGADDWAAFWQELAQEPELADLFAVRQTKSFWEGHDDGQPRSFHLQSLAQAGFEHIEFHWQYLGDAILGARKPDKKG